MLKALVILVTLTTSAVCRSNDQLVAPGEQLPQVVEFLEEIIVGFETKNKALENLKIRGRVVSIASDWLG